MIGQDNPLADRAGIESGDGFSSGEFSVSVHLDFRGSGNARNFVVEGFSHPEPTHTWALSPRCTVRIPCRSVGDSAFALVWIDDLFFSPKDGSGLRVVISVNGRYAFDDFIRSAVLVGIEVSSEELRSGILLLGFEFPGATTPRGAGFRENRPLTARFADIWLIAAQTRRNGPLNRCENAVIQTLIEANLGNSPPRPLWSLIERRDPEIAGPLVLFAGNCLAELLRSGLASNSRAAGRYRFAELPLHLRTVNEPEAQAVIGSADYIFVQGIVRGEFEKVTGLIQPACRVIFYPDVILRDVWPFLSGEGEEKIRASRQGSSFTHVDFALERLRTLEPEPTRRLEAYKALAHGLQDASLRIAEAQARYLSDIDHRMGTSLGRYIRDNFRVAHLFSDPTHPTTLLGQEMCRFVASRLHVEADREIYPGISDHMHWAVPVHPTIAHRLGLAWAGPDKKFPYGHFGEVTWEEWVQAYIHEYG